MATTGLLAFEAVATAGHIAHDLTFNGSVGVLSGGDVITSRTAEPINVNADGIGVRISAGSTYFTAPVIVWVRTIF